MGLTVPTTMPLERDDQPMPYDWFVGIDWGSQQHQVCVLDRDRRRVGERVVPHDGASLARLADWLWTMSVGQPQRVAVAIEGVPVNGIKLGPNGLLCQLVTQYMTWFRHEGILLGSPLLDPGFDPIGTPEIDEQLFQWHPTFGGT